MTRLFYSALLVLTCCATSWAQPNEVLTLEEAMLRGPAVASVLDMPRKTPAEQLSAVFTLLDLGEGDVAALVWEGMSVEDFGEGTQAELVEKFGTARFLKLARRGAGDRLSGVRAFVENCLAAAAKRGRDPKRLAKLIGDLGDESEAVRHMARADLAVTGDAGAVVCLEALARADEPQLRTELLLTLARMRPGVEPLLVASVAEGRGQFRRDVVELTGYLHLQDAVPWLAAIVAGADQDPRVVSAAYAALEKMGLSTPSQTDARAVVLNAIGRLESRRLPTLPDAQWWSFDVEKKRLAARTVTPTERHLLTLGRLTRLLGELPGATSGDRRLALIYAYQISRLLDQPLPSNFQQSADALGAVELSEILREAIDGHQLTAAIACARLLGSRGDAAALHSRGDGRRSPLAAALVHGNRELRFAALEAIMKLAPKRSFAGASGVPRALWSFATGAGAPQVVVASSVAGQANDWAGQLRGLGYEALPVATGREALRVASELSRLELILLDSDVGRPLLREVVYQLRNSSQMAHLPVAVLSSSHGLSRARHLAEHDGHLLATPRPHDLEAMKTVLSRLGKLGTERPTLERRSAQAVAALGWLAQLLETGHPYDEMLRDAQLVSQTLYTPELTKASIRLLAVLGTAGSQQLLVDCASTHSLPIAMRQRAVDALEQSVGRYGKLLTAEETHRQYDRYNASETADSETKKVLGQVLDTLEK